MKFRVKDIIFIVVVVIGLALFIYQKIFHQGSMLVDGQEYAHITINEAEIWAEIADERKERYYGLGNRERMDFDKGMLFIHDDSAQHSYSMRGMTFDLDFIFVSDGKVVDIAKNIAYEYPGRIKGGTDYDKVLEVNAGWVRANEIELGDEVTIEK